MMWSSEDRVHGKIKLPKYAREVISSETFQRLKNLKQLGVSNYVYKNATHSRFDHSIGTAYLAQRLLDTLEKTSNIQINDANRKCVILAALLHDLGHGPYSHLWEDCVHEGVDKKWTHEDQSVKMIKYIISNNQIKLDCDDKKHQYMLDLICSLITGDSEEWSRLLKPSEWFITEIVSNKLCNIDVDKGDYLLRDHHYVGLDIAPFVDFWDRALIISDDNDGRTHIGYHADDFYLIENMFVNRARYHDKVYQLPRVAGVEKQLKDICIIADRAGFKMMGLRITEIQQYPETYNKLDDSILDLIRDEKEITNDDMNRAQELIESLDNDKFYTHVWETKDKIEANYIYEKLCNKFGAQAVCKVKKCIPSAQVPKNIPLYDNNGFLVNKVSNYNLEYESTIFFCTAFDNVTIQNISNYLSNINNNNEEA